MRRAFDRVRQRVRVVVHRVDAPRVARALGAPPSESGTAPGRAGLMFGAAMSIFARNTQLPSSSSPRRMDSNNFRFSAGERSRYGLFLPGSVSVPRFLRISSALWWSTYASPRLDELHGEVVDLLK